MTSKNDFFVCWRASVARRSSGRDEGKGKGKVSGFGRKREGKRMWKRNVRDKGKERGCVY